MPRGTSPLAAPLRSADEWLGQSGRTLRLDFVSDSVAKEADLTKVCQHCGNEFEGKRRTAKYCSAKCRKDANNAKRSPTYIEPGNLVVAKAAKVADAPRSTLVEAVEAELTTLGKLDTVLGGQALDLARRMSDPKETGAAVAAISRELRSVMVLVSREVEVGDDVDELKAKRDEKRQAAARAR